MTAHERLAEAKHAGADRLYGYPVGLRCHPSSYLLTATDGSGRIYFRREMLWDTYCDAVRYWMSIGSPNLGMLSEGAAA